MTVHVLKSKVAGSNTWRLTKHPLLHRAVGIIEKQKELLEEELQVSRIELRVVFFGQNGQPEPDGSESGRAHVLTAVVQPLQQLCAEIRHISDIHSCSFYLIIHTLFTRIDLVEDIGVQTFPYAFEYGGHRTTGE